MTAARTESVTLRRAIISVSDKTDIVELAGFLSELGVEILSTGGTAKLLESEGIQVTEVANHTGFPEMMAGRIKTLHPRIHGGILGRRGEDDAVMEEHGIAAIDLVIVNLYPFEETIAKANCTLADAIENIDIGGPAMVRAAAKNHTDVAVVVDPEDYPALTKELLESKGSLSQATHFNFAVKAFEHTAHYDGMIATYLGKQNAEGNTVNFGRTINLQFSKSQDMRYGENPHQKAAFYTEKIPLETSISTARKLQGKELSYNNIGDTDAALECVKQFATPACVIVKHANPCGVAVAENLLAAYEKAFKTDPTSAFGGIIAFNRVLDKATAEAIVERQFVEVIIAPEISKEAQEVVAKKKNIRLLESGSFSAATPTLDYKRVNGGLLVQERDLGMITTTDLKTVSKRAPTEQQLKDLLFAWKIAKYVKSNAIVYVRDEHTIGVGAGQMSRVYSAKIAGIKAQDEGLIVPGSVMASDAFFPFRDGIDAAHEAGISAVIQPGGSMRDDEVIQAADEHDMAMVFTGMRHFRH